MSSLDWPLQSEAGDGEKPDRDEQAVTGGKEAGSVMRMMWEGPLRSAADVGGAVTPWKPRGSPTPRASEQHLCGQRVLVGEVSGGE